MKNVTDFPKTVESGVDPHLYIHVRKFVRILLMYSKVKQSSQHVCGKDNTKNSAWPDSISRKASKKIDK